MSRRNLKSNDVTRRDFFRRAACAGVGAAAMFSTIRDLRLMSAAAADGAGSAGDYKAIVCLFLSGGNDPNNVLIPIEDTSTGYQAYAAARGGIAIPRSSLLPMQLNPLTSDGHTYGLHPEMTELRDLFNTGKAAMVASVGTLVRPFSTTSSPTPRQQYTGKTVALPPQLFSHNDQVMQWHTSIPDGDSGTGWGGRMADLINATYNGDPVVSMSISLAGSNRFEVGNLVHRYNCSTSGALKLDTGTSSSVDMTAVNNVLKNINDIPLAPATPSAPQLNLYERAYADTTKTAIDSATLIDTALTQTSAANFWVTPTNPKPFVFDYPRGTATPPGSSLMNQLKMVARLIYAHSVFGHRRQVFFVQVGGYDLHDSQVTVTNTTTGTTNPLAGPHAKLLSEVSQAIKQFLLAMDKCRADGKLVAGDGAAIFTASDFGRTFPVNAAWGSDHGWASHHIVAGDGVVGQNIYGGYPVLTVNGPDDTGVGRWIPKVAVDQYAATLARWFGVSDTNLPLIFPNLPRFSGPLGFMV